MTKILRIGDPHCKVNNISEMTDLINFVCLIAKEENVDLIEILGDLFHTHALVRLEVIKFWTWALGLLASIAPTVVLEGNHDQSGDYSADFSALSTFEMMGIEGLSIITKPTQAGVFGYIPYTHDSQKFVKSANELTAKGAKVIVCHQTFNGSKYENGFYAPDGIDSELIDATTIISGHIHAQQRFGKVIYPGTARWDSTSDSNQPKGIWVYDHDSDGLIVSEKFISTESICTPIYSFSYKEGEEPPVWKEGAKVTVELVGSSAWVASEKQKLRGKCSISSKITDKSTSESRKSGDSLEHFLSSIFVTSENRTEILNIAKEYGIV